ncbi:CDP-alcohol phosphatidyltransferase family protein [Kineosporia succinea]|uniref:CDP-diacylglycerol--glycerol-3-phosphate 3-phosphatidyltransferase n=1 Tax=Kineosporia succinea TaxID=84632 RepID=A0ABT9P960_9ACTN|nr:CDP-alcohol phosphatidyltransferase family protein [Kineosporia succinea]MDP9829240.1 CDP-diacylglycerol--glycerol-3-phosphate 3-phosphatidyltransferase [Kineosporia succinea]
MSGTGLYAAKAWYTARLGVFIRWAVGRNVSPDVFTAVGVIGGVVAAGFLALSAEHPNPLWALPVLAAQALRLAGANLDGAVARARGVSRPWGFVLNEIGDRAGDLVVIVVLAHYAGGWWGLIGLAGSTLPTFASLSLAGAGGPRLNGGPLGKTERCLITVLVALTATWWEPWAAACALIGVGGLITAVLRFRTGHAALRAAA